MHFSSSWKCMEIAMTIETWQHFGSSKWTWVPVKFLMKTLAWIILCNWVLWTNYFGSLGETHQLKSQNLQSISHSEMPGMKAWLTWASLYLKAINGWQLNSWDSSTRVEDLIPEFWSQIDITCKGALGWAAWPQASSSTHLAQWDDVFEGRLFSEVKEQDCYSGTYIETGSYVIQGGLNATALPRMILNFWSSCLHRRSARILGAHSLIQFSE